MKPNRKKWPALARAWDEYGHAVPFEALFDMKVSPTHGYVAVAWREGELVEYAELTSVDGGRSWEMMNDGGPWITQEQWKRARPIPDCDRLEF